MSTTYIYTTKKGLNKETFDSRGYVTLEREGVHIYEHQFGSMALKLQEQTLVMELEKRNIDYKTIKA
jgi:hypothetical protein